MSKIIKSGGEWFFLTGSGIVHSDDLLQFDERNNGLPVKVIKKIAGAEKQFIKKTQLLKDLEQHPTRPDTLVTATNSAVF